MLDAAQITAIGAAFGIKEVVKVAAKTLKEYADIVLIPPLKQIGEGLENSAEGWKYRNKIRAVLKLKKFIEENGVKPEKVLPGVFIPLLEAAGDTDDEGISDMFARLMAAHLDHAKQDKVHVSFAKVLSQFSPLDACVAKLLYGDSVAERERQKLRDMLGPLESYDDSMRWPMQKITDEITKEHKDLAPNHVELSAQNLVRLGVITTTGASVGMSPCVKVTGFGDAMMSICLAGA
jgi:hypothetical protein